MEFHDALFGNEGMNDIGLVKKVDEMYEILSAFRLFGKAACGWRSRWVLSERLGGIRRGAEAHNIREITNMPLPNQQLSFPVDPVSETSIPTSRRTRPRRPAFRR